MAGICPGTGGSRRGLSYLTMKEDRFYQVSTRGENRQFVTARGWEDLSELLWDTEE